MKGEPHDDLISFSSYYAHLNAENVGILMKIPRPCLLCFFIWSKRWEITENVKISAEQGQNFISPNEKDEKKRNFITFIKLRGCVLLSSLG